VHVLRNDLLYRYCQDQHITFTRSRPYRKNDQAHVEQKNWAVVRRLIGYDRFESEAEYRLLKSIYDDLRLYEVQVLVRQLLPAGLEAGLQRAYRQKAPKKV